MEAEVTLAGCDVSMSQMPADNRFLIKKDAITGIFLSLIHLFLEQENTYGMGGGEVAGCCWSVGSCFLPFPEKLQVQKQTPPPYTHVHTTTTPSAPNQHTVFHCQTELLSAVGVKDNRETQI